MLIPALMLTIQAILAIWTYKTVERYKFLLYRQEQAAKIAELIAEWSRYGGKTRDLLSKEQQREHFTRLNKLTWELAIWVPHDSLVRKIMERLSNQDNALAPKDIIVEVRKLMNSKTTIKGKELVHFPMPEEIGKALYKKEIMMCENNEEKACIKLAYQSTLEDIRFFKKQEWSLTYYTLLIYSVVIAAITYSKISEELLRYFGTWITMLITLSMGILLYAIQMSLKKQQEIKTEFLNKLPNIDCIYKKYQSNWIEKRFSFIMVTLLIICGYIFTIFSLWWTNINSSIYLLIFSIPIAAILLPFCLKQYLFPKN